MSAAALSGASVAGLLLAHLVGDYLAQSHWMATRKTSAWWPAIAHAAVYTACHLVVTRSVLALAGSRPPAWQDCSGTGYAPEAPAGLAVALLIVANNTVHLVLNTVAVMWA